MDNNRQQKTLPNIVNELKKCDSYSRSSKFYDKVIKSKKIREIMKTMGLIKIKGFSEFKVFGNNTKKKEPKPFNIQKIKNFLLKEELNEKEKEVIKQQKLNNTIFKKLHRMTELNIEQHKIKHQYNPPSIGTYNPNYDSIYKKAKATIILENHEDKRNKRDKFVKNNSGVNVLKKLSLNNIDNTKKFSTISNIKDYTEEKGKNNSILHFNKKYKSKYPIIFRNKNEFKNFNTISISPISSRKNKIKTIFNKKIINIEYENKNKNNTSNDSIKNNNDNLNKSNSSLKNTGNNNIDIFNKTRTYYIDSYIGNKNKKNIKSNLLSRNTNNNNSKKNLSYKTIFIKPSMPSIGYYNPKYEFIKETIPKISFLYHSNKKDDLSYKKNLLRKEITKYNINTEYQIITSLNNK